MTLKTNQTGQLQSKKMQLYFKHTYKNKSSNCFYQITKPQTKITSYKVISKYLLLLIESSKRHF